MKKPTYLIGLTGWLLTVAGFVIDGIGGAGVIVLIVFLPLFCYDQFLVAKSRTLTERWTIVLGIAGAGLVGLGLLIKNFHLPGAGYLMGPGLAVTALGFVPLLLFVLYKKSIS